MGRVDDKEGESLLSEAEEEKDKDKDTSEADEEKDTEKEASDSEGDSLKKYKCTQPGCKARFLRPSRLTWHLRTHNDKRPYKCDQEGCSRAYTNSSHLKRHLNTTHKSVTKTYEMGRVDDKEGESLLSEAEEEKDKDRDTSEAEEEKDKDRDTSEADEGKDTEKEASDSEGDSHKKYKCTQPGCKARFLRPSRLTWHLRKHNDERPYKCDQEGCSRAYTNSSHLKRHLNTTHKPVTKTYECKECGMELGSLFSLKRHNKKIHDPTRLTCAECGAKFRKKHCYNEHLSMHAGIAMYKCDICDQNLTTLRLYKKHHRIHEGLKTYPCTSAGCTQIFDKWSKLSKHLEVEHEFDYKCEKCDKKFKHKRQLVVHSAVHERKGVVVTCPYQNCPRFYTYTRNLDEHIQTAHMGRKFICDICEKPFNFKSAVARHIQVKHEGKSKPPSKRKTPRRRKDAGLHKKSMAAKLVGLELPKEVEKRILLRNPRIILEKIVIKCSDKSKQEDKTASSSSLTNTIAQNGITNDTEKREEGSSLLSEKKNEIIASSLTSDSKMEINESNTAMIVDDHLPEFTNTTNEKNEKLVVSVMNSVQNATTTVREDIEEKSWDTLEKINEVVSTSMSDVLQRESPLDLAEFVEEFDEQKNKAFDLQFGKKSEVIASSLSSVKEIVNNENETAFILDDHVTQSTNMNDAENEKLVLPLDLVDYVEEFADTTEKKNDTVDILSAANPPKEKTVPQVVMEILGDWA